MSERASIRGGRGGRGGRGDSTGRGGRGGYSGDHKGQQDRPKKESILDLKKYAGKAICVKFSGGREVTGTLKGYDQLMNLVLDNVQEIMTGKLSVDDFLRSQACGRKRGT